ncbi:membrane protein, partial [Desulfosporosinus sp. Tol-M]
MLIETVILAVFISLISGGKMSRLGQLNFRKFRLVPLAL